MRKVIWSTPFVRSVKRAVKRRATLRNDIEQTLKLLARDTFAPSLETHKLKGKLAGFWACSVGYDLRIVFDFVQIEGEQEAGIKLLEIGTHDEVY
ncbi:MAG TPA: type II toxin-antitoxin system mRNA interferase toxin, RelE/StbE family [Blastocatellia bacterium]|jgi:addiction module RelE/StbE family toxin|nr:type II toxin-antitoxin system mRNA interferase toxin, RelE/StbE family [Blastocatellia bacterium]